MRNIEELIGKEVRHFKGGEYFVITTALHTEDNIQLAIYKSTKGSNIGQVFARPVSMFLEEVPNNKPNPTGQKYRLEIIK